MTADQYSRLYAILRGPQGCADALGGELLDVFAMEELEQIQPVIWDIKAQAEARARLQCLLELMWALKQAQGIYAEVGAFEESG